MQRLSINSKGKFSLEGKVVKVKPIGEPRFVRVDLKNLEFNVPGEADSFVLGSHSVTETIYGRYEVYSKAVGRSICMDGPRAVIYRPIQFYRIIQ